MIRLRYGNVLSEKVLLDVLTYTVEHALSTLVATLVVLCKAVFGLLSCKVSSGDCRSRFLLLLNADEFRQN